jgi:hypothetical protein
MVRRAHVGSPRGRGAPALFRTVFRITTVHFKNITFEAMILHIELYPEAKRREAKNTPTRLCKF